jgi:hypothetical protein
VLHKEKKDALVLYVKKMQSIGQPLTFTQLRFRVVEITWEIITPFKNGILGWKWLKWFKKRILDLSLRVVQGLDVGRAKGVCPTNVASFYTILTKAYNAHDY